MGKFKTADQLIGKFIKKKLIDFLSAEERQKMEKIIIKNNLALIDFIKKNPKILEME